MEKCLNDIKSSIALRNTISLILESASLKVGVKNLCDKYTKLLESGYREEELAGGFINEMSKFNKIDSIGNALHSLNKNVDDKKQKNNNAIICEMSSIKRTSPQVFSIIEGVVVDYLTSKTDASKDVLMTKLNLFGGHQEVRNIMEAVQVDGYIRSLGQVPQTVELYESDAPEFVYTKDQVDKLVSEAVERSKQEEAQKLLSASEKSIYSLPDRTGLLESIENILAKESRNKKVKQICEHYRNIILEGRVPAAVCEAFVSTMGPFGYLNAVDTELSALTSKMTKYKQEINLVRIIDAMKESTSYYIAPHIEEAVVAYMKNKCQPTRVMLVQACESFRFDPFVKDILYIVNSDQSRDQLYLGNTIELAESCKVFTTFSPIQYINETSYVFNAFGNYYTKSNTGVTKLPKENIAKLDESYKHVCDVINSGYVSYDVVNDLIVVKAANTPHIARISESGEINIDGSVVTLTEISKPEFLGIAQYEGSLEFYDKVISLANCNTLANIDFAKRVTMNESNKSVDVFRSGDKISICLNEGNESQFRGNINPIKCKKYINEHMEMVIDSMFEDIMPNQRLLESSIDEAKNAYESYLQTLKDSKEELLAMRESGDNDDNADEINVMIGALDKEIEDITKNYKKVQKDADDLLSTDADDDKSNTDSDSDDDEGNEFIDDLKDDLSKPLDNDEPDNHDDANDMHHDDTIVTDDTITVEPDDSDFDDYNELSNIVSSEFDSIFDTVAPIEKEDDVKIIDVSFEKNVKSGKVSNKGSVTIMIPTVNSNGDIKNEIKTVTFYLDPNDKKPIINNDSMQLSMYNAILAAIQNSPSINDVDFTGDTIGTDNIVTNEPAPIVGTPVVGELELHDDDVLGGIEEPSHDVYSQISAQDGKQGLDSTVNGVDRLDSSVEKSNIEDESLSDPIFKNDRAFRSIGGYPFDFIIAKEDIVENGTNEDRYEHFKNHLKNIEKAGDDLSFVEEKRKDEKGNTVDVIVITINKKTGASLINDYILNKLKYKADEWIEDENGKKINVGYFGAYPEMKTFECVNIARAQKIYEAIDTYEGVVIEIPHDDNLYAALEDAAFNIENESMDIITIETPGQYDTLINFINNWLYSEEYENDRAEMTPNTRQELVKKLDAYRLDGGNVRAKNSSGLEYQLDKDGVDYFRDDEGIIIPVSGVHEANKVIGLSKKYKFDERCVERLSNIMNEGILITIEDTETKKKITIDTDDLDKEGETDDGIKNNDDKSDTSFGDDTELFDTKQDADNADKQDGAPTDPNESVAKKPASKKFKFKKKVTESIELPSLSCGRKVIYKDKKGKYFPGCITGVRQDGKLIVVLMTGQTITTDPKNVKIDTREVTNTPIDTELTNPTLVGPKDK